MALSIRLIVFINTALILSACSSIPDVENGQDMRAAYNNKMSSVGQVGTGSMPTGRRELVDVDPNFKSYTRQVQNETDNLFPTLPNPTLFLYVRPRTVGTDGLPVPGYTVPFKLWPRDIHAMPGEVHTDSHLNKDVAQ